MDRRVVWSAWATLLSVCCALVVAAGCSSQKAAPGSDGGGNIDAQPDSGQGIDTTLPSSCESCSVTSHTLTQGAPPGDTCTFTIGQVPPVPADVLVRAGGLTIPESESNGWVYLPGMMSIALMGSSCDSIQDAGTTTLTMLFGCGSCPIP
jgi:hypothetical protein